MVKKNGVSIKTFTIIGTIWGISAALIALEIKEAYHLNLWQYLCIAVPLMLIPQILLRKVIKPHE